MCASAVATPCLVIGIPPGARSNNEEYLLQTLTSLLQLAREGVFAGRVRVVVMKMIGKPHPVFEQAKQMFGRDVEFVEEQTELLDPTGKTNDPGTANVPGARVRKQTRNLASLVQYAAGKRDNY